MGQRAIYGSLLADVSPYRARAARRNGLTRFVMGAMTLLLTLLVGGVLYLLGRVVGLFTDSLGGHLYGAFQRQVDGPAALLHALASLLF